MIQRIEADGYDLKTGKPSCAAPYDRPYDRSVSGDTRLFSAMVTPAGLAEIKTCVDGIGSCKPYIVPIRATLDSAGNIVDRHRDGKRGDNDAHKAGLFVQASHSQEAYLMLKIRLPVTTEPLPQ